MPDVLVVEDEAVLRMTFGQFLEDEGYAVATAENFTEAIQHLDTQVFDVIVTDIILGGKTGVDLLREVHARKLRTSVIMITGEPNVNTAAEAVRLGAYDYLAKPVNGRELKRVVRLALEQQQLSKERDQFARRMDRYRRELEAIFNSVNEGIITVGHDLAVQQVNAFVVSLLNIDAEVAKGNSLDAILGKNLSTAVAMVRDTIASGIAQEELTVETSLAAKGTVFLSLSCAPLLDGNGDQQGAVLLIRDLTRLHRLEQQLNSLPQEHELVGKSSAMRRVRDLIAHAAQTDTTTLICGESGTGKELAASALHYASSRASKPFIKVNCAALSDDLLESELFGHVKGAFTGAHRDRAGRFEAANGGTILLDEIGDISPRLQMRLLRVLQEREFERVGDSLPIRVDVRIVASTNRDLPAKIAQGIFREDLYYRINVLRVDLPPLRDRPEDIPLLVDTICTKLNARFKKKIQGLSKDALDLLLARNWPGNVRELENWLERAYVVCHGDVILPEHLPEETETQQQISSTADVARNLSKGRLTPEAIRTVLEQTDWNIAKSARILGVARNTLYQRIRDFGIERPGD